MKLFECSPTRSIRVRWTLQELEVDFEATTVNLLTGRMYARPHAPLRIAEAFARLRAG